MKKSVGEIAVIIGGELCGDEKIVITGFSGLKEAKIGDLSFVANPKYVLLAENTQASAIIIPRELSVPGKTFIRADNPSLAFSKVVALFFKDNQIPLRGIHPTAVVAPNAKIASGVALGPNVVIEPGAVIGANTAVHAGSYIGHDTVLGEGCLIYPNVTIRERVLIGNCVTIHSGTVVGSDGFGYVTIDGKHQKIPQLGTVVIENDVEIGACVTIDRARFDKTLIGAGTKIDNLVQVAHNVVIGEGALIAGQAGISGSVTIGQGAILAGQAGIAGHLTIGDGAIVSAKAGVSKSVAPHTQVTGYPARPIEKMMEVNAHVQLLPKYVKTIHDLKKRVEELEKKLNNENKET